MVAYLGEDREGPTDRSGSEQGRLHRAATGRSEHPSEVADGSARTTASALGSFANVANNAGSGSTFHGIFSVGKLARTAGDGKNAFFGRNVETDCVARVEETIEADHPSGHGLYVPKPDRRVQGRTILEGP